MRCVLEYTLDEKRAKEAYEALIKYLAASPRSKHECVEKLYDKGFHRQEVDFAIEKAEKYRYINDEEFIRTFVFYNKSRYGKKKLLFKLTSERGIDKTLAENMLDDLIDDEFEKEICMEFAKKYVKQKHIEDRASAGKLGAFLYQKGFDWSVINIVISELFDIFSDD